MFLRNRLYALISMFDRYGSYRLFRCQSSTSVPLHQAGRLHADFARVRSGEINECIVSPMVRQVQRHKHATYRSHPESFEIQA